MVGSSSLAQMGSREGLDDFFEVYQKAVGVPFLTAGLASFDKYDGRHPDSFSPKPLFCRELGFLAPGGQFLAWPHPNGGVKGAPVVEKTQPMAPFLTSPSRVVRHDFVTPVARCNLGKGRAWNMRLRHMLVGVVLASSTALWAAAPNLSAQGMGSTQPSVQNVSKSPSWRVYRFWRDGIEYLQVNDTAGQVHMGFGTANGLFIVLPMGSDAAQVSTPMAPLNVPVTGGQVVYQDAQATVTVGVNNTGQNMWTVATTPLAISPAATSQAAMANGTCDPNDCGINRISAQ